MKGLMQDWPLLVHRVLDHAARWHGEQEIVSRSVEGPIHRQTYRDLDRRARALASAAKKHLKARKGSIIATMAWDRAQPPDTTCSLPESAGAWRALHAT